MGADSNSSPPTSNQAWETVRLEFADLGADAARAAICTLDRPDSLNALNWQMIRDLEAALTMAEADPMVRVVFITGAGRAFSAGGDLKSYVELQHDPIRFPQFVADLHRTFSSIADMRSPVIALVNGVTAAGGLELLLSCDFAYAAESARIGDLHLKFAQIGGGGVLARLPRTISPPRARELIFSADLLDAQEAAEFGIVNRVVRDDDLLHVGLEFARGLASKSQRAIATAKAVLNGGLADGTGLHSALRLERESTARYCLTLPDAHEGLAAFAEKRVPRYASLDTQ